MTVQEFINNSGLRTIDSKLLLEYVAGIETSEIIAHPEHVLTGNECTLLSDLVEKRKAGTPVEYLVGHKSFYRDVFNVCEGVLIPQPDTEILVEQAIQFANTSGKQTFRLLDLCAGTGCVGISVAREIADRFEDFEVVFSDISPIAIKCCTDNAKHLLDSVKYRIVQGDLFENLANLRFDLIVTNPPYIETEVIKTLESDVRHEPMLALDGGKDGLDLIRKIAEQSHGFANTDGALMMEIGYNQGKEVKTLFEGQNLKKVCIIKDLGSRDRVVKGFF